MNTEQLEELLKQHNEALAILRRDVRELQERVTQLEAIIQNIIIMMRPSPTIGGREAIT